MSNDKGADAKAKADRIAKMAAKSEKMGKVAHRNSGLRGHPTPWGRKK